MSGLVRTNMEQTVRSEFCNNTSNKKHRKTEADGMISSSKQKYPTINHSTTDQEDFEKIIDFLKSIKEPQKTITIARACGYKTAKHINPSLYQMERKKLLQKANDRPPLWCLSHTAGDISGNVISSPRQQYDPDNTCQAMIHQTADLKSVSECPERCGKNSKGNQIWSGSGMSRCLKKIKYIRSTEEPKKHAGGVRSNLSASNVFLKAGAVSHEASMCNATVQTNQSINHGILFKKTINDKNAPGAYKVQDHLEHSHEKRTETFDFHRRHSANYPSKMASEQPMIHYGYKENYGVPSSECDGGKYFADNRAISSVELQNGSRELTPDGANLPDFLNNNTDATMGDESEYTDDEDYDLNFRISEVVSIRDPDISADLQVLKTCDVKFITQNYTDSETSCDKDQQKSTFNMPESDQEEVWVDGFLGPSIHSEMCQSETDSELSQKIKCLKLLGLLIDLPLKSTVKSFLVSELHMAQGDLQKLLDTCSREGWIDYSPFNHVRLTEAGKELISEIKQSRKYDESVTQQCSGPPPFPDKLLQNITLFKYGHDTFSSDRHRSITERSDMSNTPQDYSVSNHDYFDEQCKISDDSILCQMNPARRIALKDKKLMPWLSSSTQMLCKEQVIYSTEVPNIVEPSSGSSSLLPMPQITTSLSVYNTSSSFKQHLLRDTKTYIPNVEYPAFVGCLKQSKRMSPLSYAPILSQQEYLQQKRPPLLSTPDTRESNNFSRCSTGSAKLALLPCPVQSMHQLQQQLQFQQQETPTNLQISTESFAALNKNPISAFMEYGQCRHTPSRIEVLSQSGPSHKPVFTIAAVLGSRIFPGITSSNKKDGKKDAAEQAIRILIAEGQYNMPASSSVMSIPESSMTQFDKIAALTHHKFNQLIAVIPESLVGRKVIAGLVMKMNDADTGTVVAIGSGNRCITGDKLSLRGLTLNDCHAEIITRRGFIRYLYYQLKSYDSNKYHPLFEKSTTGKLRIKRSITFHLYISTAPCGDGALFSPRDVESNNVTLTDTCSNHRPTFDTNVQGVLRTKMEGGEGTIPVDPEKLVQTWDGIVRGERLRTMSCSDKICRWNVVGLQGALLANFLDPVYLTSITLGFLFDAGHLSRAVCCRLNRGEPSLDRNLPFPYRLNHPALGRVTACDATRETQKTKSYSINWMVEDEKPEIVDGCQGTCYTGDKNEPSQSSRLCKKYLFECFNQTCQILGHQEFLTAPTYFMAKRFSTKFHQAKEAMITKFKDTNCGIWLGKPSEEEMFS